MQEILDLQGASGDSYRFRRIANPGQLPATSGNFVHVRWSGNAAQIVYCGAVNTLTSAADRWAEAVGAHGAAGLYVRLNVARRGRDEEHADLVAKHRPLMGEFVEF